MAELCGWLSFSQPPQGAGLELMHRGLAAKTSAVQRAETDTAGCLVAGGSAAARGEGLVGAIVGRPRWSDPSLTRVATEQGSAQALLEAYRRHGTDLLEYIQGAFALLVINGPARHLLAATDRIGQFPLVYRLEQNRLLVASSADSLRAVTDLELAEQGIFDYLYFHMIPSPQSIYQGVDKLPGGHFLDYRHPRLTVAQYWLPRFQEEMESGQDLGLQLCETLQRAVARACEGPDKGAFLSGGLDSSTVVGMMARVETESPPRSYSIGFAEEGYDEIGYARIVAEHFHARRREYYVTPQDVVDAVPLIASAYDEPFGNSSAVPTYYCARLGAEDGLQRLLAGDGGDELFAGNARYAKQRIFERYRQVPGSLRTLFEPLLFSLPDNLLLFRKAQSYVRQANIPLPDRLETYNFLHRQAADKVFNPDFLANVNVNQPLTLQRQRYDQLDGVSSLNRMLYLDWQQTLADNDLRKVNRMCDLAGIEVVYPMLDDEVVKFSCRVPSKLKLKDGQLRYFYKRSLEGFLPQATLTKNKHGFGLPFGLWMSSHPALRDMAHDSLQRLRQRSYFRSQFIDQAIEWHQGGHAAYFGELLWILMMLELWLEAHGY